MLPKLVLDTNTFVSAFFWKGNEAELLRKIEQGRADLYVSIEILAEIEEVIKRPKFSDVIKAAGLTPAQIVQKIASLSHLIIAQKLNVSICRDEKDNKFLECAENAKADRESTVTLAIKPYSGEVAGEGFKWGVSHGNFMRFSVHDTGPGFPTDRPLLEQFNLGVSSTNGSKGFGLHFVKLACKYMAAPLTAHSEPGNTSVDIYLPILTAAT